MRLRFWRKEKTAVEPSATDLMIAELEQATRDRSILWQTEFDHDWFDDGARAWACFFDGLWAEWRGHVFLLSQMERLFQPPFSEFEGLRSRPLDKRAGDTPPLRVYYSCDDEIIHLLYAPSMLLPSQSTAPLLATGACRIRSGQPGGLSACPPR
jgi:hypothetical protein